MSAITKLFGGGGGGEVKAPAVAPMPDEQDPAVLAARKRRYEMSAERSGRSSTILSDAYGNDKLGGRA